jgi:hypothetical protein
MRNSPKTSWQLTLVTYSLVVTGSLLAYSYKFPTSNLLTDLPYIQARLYPDIYRSDFYVQEFLRFSPRYYYQYLIALTHQLGISLPLSYFLYYFIAFASFILGLYAIGRRFGQSKLSGATLVFLALVTVDGTVGFVDIFRPEPIPAMLAMGLTIWGIYCCFCHKWILGYLFFGLACLLQFLIGFLPGCMIAPLLILNAKKNNNYRTAILSFLTLCAFASLVYVPMTIAGSTGTTGLDNADFVYLYGYIRHPHHIILSSFEPRTWRNFIFFTIGGILFIKSSDSLRAEDKFNFLVIIGTSFLALLLGYVFVELYPLSAIAKLQLARTTPFAQLMAIVALCVIVNEYYKRGNIIISLLLLVTPIVQDGAILLFIIAALISTNKFQVIRSKSANLIILLSLPILLVLYPTPSFTPGIFKELLWKFVLFLILIIPFILEEIFPSDRTIKIGIFLLSFLTCIFFIFGVFARLPNRLLATFQGRIKISEVSQGSLARLALRFGELSSKDALILIPPSRYDFRFYSQRSVVVDFKSFPFTDRGILEWEKRMEALLGQISYPLSLKNADLLYRNRSSDELVNAANKFDANYILTKIDWHPDINGVVVAREGEWIIYQINTIHK